MTLWDQMFGRPSETRGLHYWEGQDHRFLPWAALVDQAGRAAAGLRGQGVGPGSAVGGVMANTPDAVVGLMAVWLAGGAFVSLPDQARGMSPREYATQLATLAAHAGVELVLVDDPGHLAEDGFAPVRHRPWAWLAGLTGHGVGDGSPPEPDDTAFVQYSSGSTGRPKGCMLTPRAIDAQIDIIVRLTGGVPGESTMASWIPLSHDMGMFGCLLFPCALGFDFVMSSPLRFIMAPRTWFDDMARFGATITAATNTALSVAVHAQRSARLPAELRLEACVIGAEPNEPAVFRRAIDTFGPSGLRPEALISAYGLAEATLAVAGTPMDQAPRSVTVDRYALEEHKVVETAPDDAGALELASCGPPCQGVQVRAGQPGEVTELLVASPSLAAGYAGDADLTAERFRDGWLRTGDLGFLSDGEVVVVGRGDDTFSIGGRNIYAPELERAIGESLGLRPGRVMVVDVAVEGRRELVALVEPRDPDIDAQGMARSANRAVTARCGVDLRHCFFVAKGGLPKTPSGKTQRQRGRNLVHEGRLELVADVSLSS